jgi:hypothetical protein
MGIFQNIVDLFKSGSQHKRHNILFEREFPELTDEEKENIINFFAYWESPCEGGYFDPTFKDDMLIIASRIVVREQVGSAALLMEKLFYDYNLAGRLIDQMEAHDIVGPYEGGETREVKIADETSLNQYLWDIYEEDKDESGEIALGCEYIASPQIIDFIEEHRQVIKERREEYLNKREAKQIEKGKEEIKQNILEKERKKRLEHEVKYELIEDGLAFNNNSSRVNRELIPQDVMDKVWNRDGGKCVKCGSTKKLEFDHIIPISKGGANTYRNLQLLCENCNRKKSNKIG